VVFLAGEAFVLRHRGGAQRLRRPAHVLTGARTQEAACSSTGTRVGRAW
jgi:hypothetical protein